MHLHVGTSGYSYKEWKGTFYPERLPPKDMLSYYAQRFSTVEINNTFYRMPSVSVIESWAAQVPGTFRFVLKAPQTITHRKRLINAEDDVDCLLHAATMLQDRLGSLLFQLPPNLKKDLPRLEAFLQHIGNRIPLAFEFRHESWFDEDVFACLRANSCALCVADVDDSPPTGLISTAGWGYVRLRRADYTDGQLADWFDRIKSRGWDSVYVFFKHEDTATGPRLAARLLELAGR